MHVFYFLAENQLVVYVWTYCWNLYPIPPTYVSVFMAISCCFGNYDSEKSRAQTF